MQVYVDIKLYLRFYANVLVINDLDGLGSCLIIYRTLVMNPVSRFSGGMYCISSVMRYLL